MEEAEIDDFSLLIIVFYCLAWMNSFFGRERKQGTFSRLPLAFSCQLVLNVLEVFWWG